MFVTERLVFRGLHKEHDAAVFNAWFNDAFEVESLTNGPALPSNAEAANRLFERSQGLPPLLAIALKPDEPVLATECHSKLPMIGLLNLSGSETVYKNRSIHLGIMFSPNHVGKGFGTETLRFALDFAFYELGLHRVALQTRLNNHAALKCYEKIGFRQEGLELASYFKDGEFHNIVCMAILENEWRKLNPNRPTKGYEPLKLVYA